jgi:hypothetical protein
MRSSRSIGHATSSLSSGRRHARLKAVASPVASRPEAIGYERLVGLLPIQSMDSSVHFFLGWPTLLGDVSNARLQGNRKSPAVVSPGAWRGKGCETRLHVRFHGHCTPPLPHCLFLVCAEAVRLNRRAIGLSPYETAPAGPGPTSATPRSLLDRAPPRWPALPLPPPVPHECLVVVR